MKLREEEKESVVEENEELKPIEKAEVEDMEKDKVKKKTKRRRRPRRNRRVEEEVKGQESEEVEKSMEEKETITDIVRKEEVEERVANRRRMTTWTVDSLKEELNRKFPIHKQHMWPNNRPASKAQAARRGKNRHILLWGQRNV
nr:WD repeat-containing protein 87-like isoform X3 [Danio rerio]|eukprot:XP_021327428.1 WD repeat-containing protein 87-like isoform X3 [Danio rerio]